MFKKWLYFWLTYLLFISYAPYVSGFTDTTLAANYFQTALKFQEKASIDSAIFFNKKAIAALKPTGKTIPNFLVEKSFEYEKNFFELYKKKRDFELADVLLDSMLLAYKDSIYLTYIFYAQKVAKGIELLKKRPFAF